VVLMLLMFFKNILIKKQISSNHIFEAILYPSLQLHHLAWAGWLVKSCEIFKIL